MRGCGAQPPLLCSGGSRFLRSARRSHWRRALSVGCRRRVVASLGAVAVVLLSRRHCTRRRSCAPRVCRATASDAAALRSAAARLQRRLVLSALTASSSVAARAFWGPPLASRRVLQSGRRRAALAVPLHAAPVVRSSRPPHRSIRCGGAALGRRFPAAAARALCAVRVVVIGGARFLRAAVGQSSRPLGRSPSRCSRGVTARGAARRSSCLPCRLTRCGGVALGRRSSAAAARALCAVCVIVSGGTRSLQAAVSESSRPSGRSPSRCPRGAAVCGAGRALLAPTAPPHPMRQ